MNSQANSVILVVEDDAFLLSMISDTLTDEGWAVFSAQHGEEAWQLIRQSPPQLFRVFLADIRMPYCSGVELGWRLLQARHPVDCFVLASMWLAEECEEILRLDRSWGESCGHSPLRCLAKPYGPRELKSALKNTRKG